MYVVKPYYSPDLLIEANSSTMYSALCYYGDNKAGITNKLPNDHVSMSHKSDSRVGEVPLSHVSASPTQVNASETEQKLLENRQKMLIDRLNSIKKQLDQLQSKFRNNNNLKKVEVCEKVITKTSNEAKKETTICEHETEQLVKVKTVSSKPETRQLVPIVAQNYTSVNNSIVFEELTKIGQQVNICITANPNRPPFTILVLCHLARHRYGPFAANVYVHSSVVNELSEEFLNVFDSQSVVSNQMKSGIIVHFIWKDEVLSPTMTVKCRLGRAPVYGEETIAKYLSKIANLYEENGANNGSSAEPNDAWCKTAGSFAKSNNKGKERILKDINVQLGKNNFVLGSNVSLTDIALWSALSKAKMNKEESVPGNVKRWLRLLNNDPWFDSSKRLADLI